MSSQDFPLKGLSQDFNFSQESNLMSQDTMRRLLDECGGNMEDEYQHAFSGIVSHTSSLSSSDDILLNGENNLRLSYNVNNYAVGNTNENGVAGLVQCPNSQISELLPVSVAEANPAVAVPAMSPAVPVSSPIGVPQATPVTPALPSGPLHAVDAMCSLPCTESYPGCMNFEMTTGQEVKQTKSAPWAHSEITNKLYAQRQVVCPFKFRVRSPEGAAAGIMGPNLYIRAVAVFKRPEHLTKAVNRCPLHMQEIGDSAPAHANHFVWCNHNAAHYVTESSGRQAVVVPFDRTQAGAEWTTCLYSFQCLNSCAGGPNKRELALIFTLEDDFCNVLGRQFIGLKVCACPGRDKKTEEGKVKLKGDLEGSSHKNGASAAVAGPSPVPTAAEGTMTGIKRKQPVGERGQALVVKAMKTEVETDKRWVEVTSLQDYEILVKIRDSLQLARQLPEMQRQAMLGRSSAVGGGDNLEGKLRLPVAGITTGQQTSFSFGQSAPLGAGGHLQQQQQAGNVRAEGLGTPQREMGQGRDSTDSTGARGIGARLESGDRLPIVTLLNKVGMEAYLDNFLNASLVYIDQVLDFTVEDYERIGMGEGIVGKLFDKIRRLTRRRAFFQRLKSLIPTTTATADSKPPGNLVTSTNTVGASQTEDGRLNLTQCSLRVSIVSRAAGGVNSQTLTSSQEQPASSQEPDSQNSGDH